jgi:hypothetical protein
MKAECRKRHGIYSEAGRFGYLVNPIRGWVGAILSPRAYARGYIMSPAARAERGQKNFASLKAVLQTWRAETSRAGLKPAPTDEQWANTQVRPYGKMTLFFAFWGSKIFFLRFSLQS